jgi:hypothetical protein
VKIQSKLAQNHIGLFWTSLIAFSAVLCGHCRRTCDKKQHVGVLKNELACMHKICAGLGMIGRNGNAGLNTLRTEFVGLWSMIEKAGTDCGGGCVGDMRHRKEERQKYH